MAIDAINHIAVKTNAVANAVAKATTGSSTQSGSGATTGSNASGAVNGGSATTDSGSVGGAAQTGSLKSNEQSDRFLKLLVAQMRNQDPLNPLDNAAVTTQMAQISTVEGIEKLNTSMEKYLSRSSGLSTLEGASLIGHRVLVKGDSMTLGEVPANGTERPAAQAGFELAQPAAVTKIDIVDSAGAVVASKTLNARETGVHSFSWDGLGSNGAPVPAGKYQFKVSAGTASDLKPVTALQAQMVSAVISSQDGTRLEIGGTGQYSLSDVKAILQETKL